MLSLSAVILLALLLRTANLLSMPIFTDEAIYLRWADDIWEQRTRMALLIPIVDDGKQPLFMWLAGAAMRLVPDPLLAGRAVSALAGVASTVGVYCAGRWLAGGSVGLVAALLHAVAPFTLLFDRMALVDGLLGTIAVWAFALGVLIAGEAVDVRATMLRGIALGAVLGAAIWTKMTALFLLPFPLLPVLFLARRRGLPSALTALAVGYGLFALFALLLALMPGSEHILRKTGTFTISLQELLSLPVDLWRANAIDHWSWIQTYLPAPLCWLALAALPWGLVFRRRHAILLMACWAAFALPAMLTAKLLYTTRYAAPGVFPVFLLASSSMVWMWEQVAARLKGGLGRERIAGVAALLLVAAPSVAFDARLIGDPSSAGLAQTDRFQYVTGWPSGYGLAEAIDLVRRRATEHGGEVIVLSNHFHGLPRDALALYLKKVPKVHHYVDGHLPWGGKGMVEAWAPHRVPLLIVACDGRDDLASFEREVPEAKRIGTFWKPGGEYSFRVYEIDLP